MRHSRIVLILWLVSIAGFLLHAVDPPAPIGHLIAMAVAFASLMGLYVLFSQPGIDTVFAQVTRNGGEYGLPGFLWVVFIVLMLIAQAQNALIEIALAAAVLWIPTALILNNQAALTPIHAALGLIVLLVPLGIDVVLGARLAAAEIALRAGAFALPVLLILLTTREQKSRLSFLFIAAVLFMWFMVEFGNLPELGLPFADSAIRYMQFALIVLLPYLLTLSGRLPDLGYTFSLTRDDWKEAGINLALFSAIAIPFGLITGFIKPPTEFPSALHIIGQGLAIFFFVALPEEILFRGVIHRYLERVLRWTPRLTLLLSSILFGAAHLDNPPNVGTYFILASVAGWFYGRTYLRTGKIVPAAVVHLMVDWVWSVGLGG